MGAVTPDSVEYLALAHSLRETGQYQSVASGIDDLVRTPGYSAFIAILLPDNDTSSYARVTIVQLALSGITTLLIYSIAYMLGNPNAGMFAAWIHALSLNSILWSLTLMSETLFSLLLVIALIFSLFFIQERNLWSLFFSGVVLGLATLTRPIGLFIILIWAVVMVVCSKRLEARRKWITIIPIFLIGSGSVILPWMVRNAIVHDHFTISTVGEKTLTGFNFAEVVAVSEGISRNQAVTILSEKGGVWTQVAWLFSRNPVGFLRAQVFGITRVVTGLEAGQLRGVVGMGGWEGLGILENLYKGQISNAIALILDQFSSVDRILVFLVVLFGVTHTFFICLLALRGAFGVTKEKIVMFTIIMLSVFTSAYLVLSGGAAGQARFRVPAEPFLSLLAGFGYVLHLRRRKAALSEKVALV
ncbi:MAG: glycosyltransferase family 39 protein [Anaerolineales bacterium]|nr:glycosyltransferase family 39 protein [Anaerolineales bacterium]